MNAIEVARVAVVSAILVVSQASAQSWVTTDDYPRAALREGRQGTVGFTVTVGIDGRAHDCIVVESSGSPDLDEQACKSMMLRARFKPATDANGAPRESKFSSTLRFEIPH